MKKRLVLFITLMVLGLGAAFAQDAPAEEVALTLEEQVAALTETVTAYSGSFDMMWLVLAAALVFFMQAGFAMVEVGLTRAKNAGNILMKNLMDFATGAVVFYMVGYGLMYGASAAGIIGTDKFFLSGIDIGGMANEYRNWIFQCVFAATAATIVSGAMAERTKFTSYLIYSVFISALIYPISGHWIWNGGWLATLGVTLFGEGGGGFHDFAGSTVVHSVGGWAALVGAIILGPRLGKYVKVGGKTVVKAIPGHNMPLAALGVFILWFGWFGFNAGSTLSGTSVDIGLIAVTTTLAASIGAIAALVTSWIWFGKPDVSMSLNGALAGLVGITAGTWVVDPVGALIIGLIAGVLVVASVEFFDKVLHVDDPVGAISVHGVCGAWGTLAVGLFADGTKGITGLFYGGGFNQLIIQLIGVAAVFLYVVVAMTIVFFLIKLVFGLRVSEKEEREGLDIGEHGSEAYSGFQIFSNM